MRVIVTCASTTTLSCFRDYCSISFNSYVTHHGGQNIRKFSYLSQVTEGIFECPKQVTKWARNGSKNQIFARMAGTVRNTTVLSRYADFDVIWGMHIILRPLIALERRDCCKKNM
jgi:hypothetical protein